ncbi:hypothetical protein QR98_0021780 [Sarcoptes scabiei]|uniref:Uncharacterized protein n=1 Tax=Sarcoptes scabiei TaxID=52283 RepID=A0A131ZYH7_SARSC|nr:hypothetical protein QR98_0021780 [Sarcoptes scabiei]
MSASEDKLRQLIKEGQNLTLRNEFESCSQWIDREVNIAKKLSDQIDRQQKLNDISSQLFNEARDMSDQLLRYIDRLRSFKKNMASSGRQVVLSSYEDAIKSDILKNAAYNTEYKSPI